MARTVSRFGLAVRREAGKHAVEGPRFESASALLSLQKLWPVDNVLRLCPSQSVKR